MNSFKKDPPAMYSDLPIDKFEYIRKLSDNDLIMMYKKYQERDNLPDSKKSTYTILMIGLLIKML